MDLKFVDFLHERFLLLIIKRFEKESNYRNAVGNATKLPYSDRERLN